MSFPPSVSTEEYPGTVQRRIEVDASVVGQRIIYTATLRDRFVDEIAGVEEPMHEYTLRLETEPPNLTVVAVDVVPGVLPFGDCPAALQAAKGLLGLRLTGGFRKGAVACLGGSEGCTHLLTLALAVADQFLVSRTLVRRIARGPSAEDLERVAGTCAGWNPEGEAVRLGRAGHPFSAPKVQTLDPVRFRNR